MLYLINKKIIFDAGKHSLAHIDRADEQQMSNIQVEILSCLVRYAGVEVTRNTLLNEAWNGDLDKASNNSLNHNIRHLRNMFRAIIPEQIIFTLHGSGYVLKAEVDVLSLQNQILLQNVKPARKRPSLHRRRRLVMRAIVLVLCAVVSFRLNILPTHSLALNALSPERASVKKRLEKCEVYSLDDQRAIPSHQLSTEAGNFIATHEISCHENEALFISDASTQKDAFNSVKSALFIAQCRIDHNVLNLCNNWYVESRRDQNK